MAAGIHSQGVHWLCPAMRGQLPIQDFHIPQRLRESLIKDTLRSETISIRMNTAFESVIQGCAERTPKRPDSWINDSIRKVFVQLHAQGHAHSLEAWSGQDLIAGLYGLAIGGAFFAESMFTRRRDTSKMVLAHLVARLWSGGFAMLDTQFLNPHLRQFGGYEMPHADFQIRLQQALLVDADFVQAGKCPKEMMQAFLARETVYKI